MALVMTSCLGNFESEHDFLVKWIIGDAGSHEKHGLALHGMTPKSCSWKHDICERSLPSFWGWRFIVLILSICCLRKPCSKSNEAPILWISRFSDDPGIWGIRKVFTCIQNRKPDPDSYLLSQSPSEFYSNPTLLWFSDFPRTHTQPWCVKWFRIIYRKATRTRTDTYTPWSLAESIRK